MPRQLDLTPGNLTVTNNPNVQLSITGDQITNLFSDLPQLTLQAIEFAVNQLLGYIDQVTGLDLVAVAKAFEGLDFSSPEAFITSLIEALFSVGNLVVEVIAQIGSSTGLDLSGLAAAFAGLDLSSPEAFIGSLVTAIGDLIGINLSSLGTTLTGIDLSSPEALLASLGTLLTGSGSPLTGVFAQIDTFVNTILGLGGTGFSATDLIRSLQSFPATFLDGPLSNTQISHLTIGSLSSLLPQFLVNPNFDTPNSLIGQGVWTWDGTQGPGSLTTSVYTTANGVLKELFSNPIAVAAGQTLNISANTKWSGFTGGANSIALTVAKFGSTNTLVGYDTIGSVASPGASGGWATLAATPYTVPSGVSSILVRPTVTAAATAGKVSFGGMSATPTATSLIASLIGALDASKITSGQFAQSFVQFLTTQLGGLGTSTSILAQLIGLFTGTTGGLSGLSGLGAIFNDITKVLGAPTALGSGSPALPGITSIPLLAGLLSGSLLNGGLIPGLDASKITSGLLSILQIPTTSLGIGNIADIQTLTDYITNTLIGAGSAFTGTSLTQSRGSMNSIYGNVLNNTQSLQALMSTSQGANVSGIAVNIDFSNYPDGAMPSNFTQTYSGAGTSALGISGGNAGWSPLNNDGNRTAISIYNVAPTNTDFQVVRGSMASAPNGATNGGQPRIWAIGRVNSPSSPTTYVWARSYCTGFLSYQADIGCTVGGVDTVFVSGIGLTWSTNITFVIGANANPRRYQIYSGSQLVYDYTEGGTTSQFGSGFRYWGAKTEMKTWGTFQSPGSPGTIAGTSVNDNQPPAVSGSTFRCSRHSTGNVGTVSGGVVATNFFDTLDWISPDMTWDPAGNNLTVNTDGTYLVNIRYNAASIPNSGKADAAVRQNGVVKALMGGAFADGFSAQAADGFGGDTLLYIHANDVIQPAYQVSASSSLTGDSAGISTYFQVALVNRSYA